MKTSIHGLLSLILILTLHSAIAAQTDSLKLVPSSLVPTAGTFYTLRNPDGPPFPCNPLPTLPVYSVGDGFYLIDDSSVDWTAALPAGVLLDSAEQQGQILTTWYDPGCAFHLTIHTTSDTANLTLHHTRSGQIYTVWSIEDLTQNNWAVETNIIGGTGDFTELAIRMGSRSNLFFRASEERNYVTNLVFDGLSYSNTRSLVPDTMGAVGPNHVIELLNGPGTNVAVALYNKSGTLISGTSMANFFAASLAGTNYPTGNMADPRILYDQQSARWIACAIQQTANIIILAVSDGPSPTNLVSGWTKFVIPANKPGFTVDYPTLGLDGNGVYIAVQHLSLGIRHHTLFAIKKPELYAGLFLCSTNSFTNSPAVRTVQPAVSLDTVGMSDYAWFLAVGPPQLQGAYQGGELWYRRLHWDGTNVIWETDWNAMSDGGLVYRNYYELAGTNLASFPDSGVTAPQAEQDSGVPINLYSAGSRIMNVTIRNGSLWTCQVVGLSSTNGTYVGDGSGAAVDRSAVQWLRMIMEPGGNGLTLREYGRIFDNARSDNWWYYYPSLAVNCAGDMVVGFSGSSVSNYICAFSTYRPANADSAQTPQIFRDGTKAITESFRWGDYSATVVDPIDDWSFWTIQEYAVPWVGPLGFEQGRWSTGIARISPNP